MTSETPPGTAARTPGPDAPAGRLGKARTRRQNWLSSAELGFQGRSRTRLDTFRWAPTFPLFPFVSIFLMANWEASEPLLGQKAGSAAHPKSSLFVPKALSLGTALD